MKDRIGFYWNLALDWLMYALMLAAPVQTADNE
jgi:hypothetical protein